MERDSSEPGDGPRRESRVREPPRGAVSAGYWSFTRTTARFAYRNLVGLVTVSLLAAFALVPMFAGALVGTWLALLGGLWATCLLLGVVTVAGLRFAVAVAERGVPVAVRPQVSPAIRRPGTGLVVGAVAFAVAVLAAVVATASGTIGAAGPGVAGFLVTAWFLIVAFAAPELAAGVAFVPAIRAGVGRLGRAPGVVGWFLVLSFAATLLAGLTVVTLALFLPGVLALLAARASQRADAQADG